MNRDLEHRIGVRIDAALDRVRSKACVVGMAGKWHIGKASDLLESPELLERYIEPLGEQEEAKYLDQLPALLAKTKEQDQICGECWDTGMSPDQESRYLAEREALSRLLLRFRFHLKLYEKLVRQPDKPLLRDAIRCLTAEEGSGPETVALERIIRMSLREFVQLEERLVDDFRDLDEARESLCTAYKDVALRIARSQPHSDESTITSALAGLRRAAAWYDHNRGYSFPEFAQHWIQEAIEKRRE